jgi:hypothetical protein
MGKKTAYVVGVHPEDHSVDLVMTDTGDRLAGVQVQAYGASERTGTVDLPDVPEKKNKWDITELTGQDIKAVVDFVNGRTPIVTGYLFPQINQVLQSDPKMRYSRHQSDVQHFIDGNGNFQYTHPSGAFIKIGEDTTKVELSGKNADLSAIFDRNTDKKVNVYIQLAGSAVQLTLGKDGNVTLSFTGDMTIQSGGNISIAADKSISMNAPSITLNKGN